MPLPVGEVLRIANEYERGGRLDDAKRLLDHILGGAPNQGDALHLAGIVAFRQGDIADGARADGALAGARHRYAALSAQHLRGVSRDWAAWTRRCDAARRATALAPADPLCLHNQAIIHYHRLELDEALDCAGRALRIDPGLPGAHFVRAEALLLRGEWAEGWEEYEWRFRIAGAAPLMPPTDKPQWDGRAVRRQHAAADCRPGIRRRDPVRALHPLGGGALSRHRDRLQRRGAAAAAADRADGAAVRPHGRMRPTMRRSARCPACRGWPARASITFPRRYRICAPIRHAQRNGRSGWTGWCRAASAASA